MDCTIHATTTQQRRICCVDNGVHRQLRYVASDEAQALKHATFVGAIWLLYIEESSWLVSRPINFATTITSPTPQSLRSTVTTTEACVANGLSGFNKLGQME